MKRRRLGIYSKVFLYTLGILLFTLCVTVLFFANQIGFVIEKTQQEQLSNIFQPLTDELNGKSSKEVTEIAEAFHGKNASFEFSLESRDGQILFQTDKFVQIPINENPLFNKNAFAQDQHGTLQKGFYKTTAGGTDGPIQLVMLTADGRKLYVNGMLSAAEVYKEYIEKSAIALILILLTSVAGAAVFARRIANPIQKIANATQKMAKLEDVPAPMIRKDEIGQLAGDVYKMYEELKSTIAQLESEIAREKEMEENQRYFFSAASHELKTPIAAMSALIEELLEGMVNSEDYPVTFRKCMKMISEQKKIISEILEIVRLSDHRLDIHNQEVNLQDAVDSILPMYQPLAEAKNIELVIEVSQQLRCHIDPKMLERVLSNVFMRKVVFATLKLGFVVD